MTHEKVDIEEVIEQAKQQQESVNQNLREAAEWFHDYYENEGDLLERQQAITNIKQHLGVERNVAARIIANLVGDIVDPITQVNTFEGKYVGVIDYDEGDIYYSYIEHNDSIGERRVVVCAQCVHDHEHEANITHAKEYSGSFEEATKAELVQAVRDHFDKDHAGVDPADVQTGATLLSGTTIAGNEAWHAGNDGAGSNLDADSVDGVEQDQIGIDPIYGDGSDGSVTNPGNQSGTINATTFTETGSLNVSGGSYLVIRAQESIDIDGTIDATGASNNGGSSGTAEQNGSPGGNGAISPHQGGGAGGDVDSTAGDGGAGGDGDTTNPRRTAAVYGPEFVSTLIEGLRDSSTNGVGAGGGGGGGHASNANGFESGDNGFTPGGGGSGAEVDSDTNNDTGAAGDGGDGGGAIILIAPEITGTGSLVADGADGQNGTDQGGAGGGGSGGIVVTYSKNNHSLSMSAAAGAGGDNDNPSGESRTGGLGADGASGFTYKIVQS